MADPVRRYVDAASTGIAIANQRSRRTANQLLGGVVGLLRSTYRAVVGGPEVPGPSEDRPPR